MFYPLLVLDRGGPVALPETHVKRYQLYVTSDSMKLNLMTVQPASNIPESAFSLGLGFESLPNKHPK